MRQDHIILGIHVTDRLREAAELQRILTQYGRNIKTRLGLHEVGGGYDAPGGIILLELVGDMQDLVTLRMKLQAIEGLELEQMVFQHD
nr:hypothetical protein [uncultured Holophaga sp.]